MVGEMKLKQTQVESDKYHDPEINIHENILNINNSSK